MWKTFSKNLENKFFYSYRGIFQYFFLNWYFTSSSILDFSNRYNGYFEGGGESRTFLFLTKLSKTLNWVIFFTLVCNQNENGCLYNSDTSSNGDFFLVLPSSYVEIFLTIRFWFDLLLEISEATLWIIDYYV